jgi:hypothetical protein
MSGPSVESWLQRTDGRERIGGKIVEEEEVREEQNQKGT